MHSGHVHLLEEVRRLLGADTAVVCVISGDFVQRGDFALVRRQARAWAAVRSGADLVLELPLSWAIAPAERFADGGVQLLLATGVVTHLAFGSECGDGAALFRLAQALLDYSFPARLRRELTRGDSFAAARQRALSSVLSEEAALLEGPNNTLGVEYCKALLRRGGNLGILTVPRTGASHDGLELKEGQPVSASAIRALLRTGQRKKALEMMAPAMAEAYVMEEQAGRGPVFWETCERAILARLRSMGEADFAALDQGGEGLYHRLYHAVRQTCSLEELLAAAKTKRYAYARLRRMALWAYLGLMPGEFPERAPYLRPLAMNATGCALLARMRKTASLPVLTRPASVRRLDKSAQACFSLEARAAELYSLAFPDLSAASGSLWREGPSVL